MRIEIAVLSSLLALAAVTILIYRFSPEGRSPQRDRVGRGGSFALGLWLRDWFYWLIRPVKRLILALRLGPGLFNTLGVVFGLGALVFFALGSLPMAGWMILLSGVADAFDGEIARAQGVVSERGAFLDSTLDRFVDLFVFVGLALYYQRSEAALVAVVAGLGGSLLVSYTRARGEALGVVCKVGFMQRAERLILLTAGSLLDPTVSDLLKVAPGTPLLAMVWIVALGAMGTAVYRCIWIGRRLPPGPTP